MKQISAAWLSILSGNAGLVSLVGARIYRGTPPDVSEGGAIQTAVSYELSGWPKTDSLSSPLPSTRQEWTFQVDGDDSDAVDDATTALRSLLHHYKGTVTTALGNVEVDRVNVDNVRGEFTGINGYHQRFLEVTVSFRITGPS